MVVDRQLWHKSFEIKDIMRGFHLFRRRAAQLALTACSPVKTPALPRTKDKDCRSTISAQLTHHANVFDVLGIMRKGAN